MNISILVPTKDRVHLICRLIYYYEIINFKGKILILDSSNKENSIKIKNYLKKSKLKIKYFYALGFPGMVMKRFFSEVDTDYVVETGDDDFLVNDGLLECINFLNTNHSYDAVNGKSINVLSKKNHNTIDGKYHYEQCNRSERKAIRRLYKHINNYKVPNFSVFRKEIFYKILSNIPSYENYHLCPDREVVDELIQSFLSVIYTKIYEINKFYMVRHITNLRQDKANDFINIDFNKREIAKKYLIKVLTNSIIDVDKSGNYKLEEKIHKYVKLFYSNKKIKINIFNRLFYEYKDKLMKVFTNNYDLKKIYINKYYKDYKIIENIIISFKKIS